jgi:hypothetical protein
MIKITKVEFEKRKDDQNHQLRRWKREKIVKIKNVEDEKIKHDQNHQ